VTPPRPRRVFAVAAGCFWLLLVGPLALPSAAGEGDVRGCPCQPFDEPDRVVRSGHLDIREARSVTGSEVYLANRTLRIGGAEGIFVVAGRGDAKAGALRLKARERIVLGPGFHARSGSRVEASIIPLRRAGHSPRRFDFARRR